VLPPARRLVAAAAVVSFALLGPAAAAAAAPPPVLATDTSDFTFDSFDAEYHLGIEGGRATLRVVETLVARFPDFDQNRGIIRAIPLRDGEVDLQVQVLSVTDEHGDPVYWERADYEGFAELALGTDEFVQGVTTYVIEYTMRDVIRHFSDSAGDEFYWDINGNGWAQPFGRVSARVLLEPELAAALTGAAACYVGYYGETGTCEISRDDSGERFDAAVDAVGPYSTLTLAIGFDGGTVVQPELPRDSWIVQLAPKVIFGLVALQLLLALLVRRVFWGDRRVRGTIIAQFEPPADSNLLLDANIIGRVPVGLPAMLIDFAVRGIIKVIDNQPSAPTALSDSQRYSIELVTADGADAQELRVLVTLFGVSLHPGKRVNPGSLSRDIGASLYGLPAVTALNATSEGLRFQAGTVRQQKWLRRPLLWTVLLFVPVWVWALWNDVLDAGVVWLAILTAVTAIVASGFLSRPMRLTGQGALIREHLLGIREYLTIAEADRMRVLQSPQGALRVDVTDRDAVVKLNERLLGYAVLWGVEDQWAAQLATQRPNPEWLEGGHLDASFVHSFASVATASVRPIVTASSSSGSSWSSSGGSSFSSGSSGGGFSGGGGGGGGGGGR
jgi:uncharacterized membrane protein YgcG